MKQMTGWRNKLKKNENIINGIQNIACIITIFVLDRLRKTAKKMRRERTIVTNQKEKKNPTTNKNNENKTNTNNNENKKKWKMNEKNAIIVTGKRITFFWEETIFYFV